MQDNHDATLRRLTLLSHSACNLACSMCPVHGQRLIPLFSPMPFQQVASILRQARLLGVEEIIPTTWGEPFLDPDFPQLLRLVAELGLRINITTNGSFPFGSLPEWGVLLFPVVSDIKFSVNALDAEVASAIMPGLIAQQQQSHVAEYANLRNLYSKTSSRISLQIIVQRRNLYELPKLLRWAAELGLDRVKIHPLWIHHPSMECESLFHNSQGRSLWDAQLPELKRIAQQGSFVLQGALPSTELCAAPEESPNLCPFLGHELWIAPDGNVRVCCHPRQGEAGFPHFGNVSQKPLGEIWGSKTYWDFVQNQRERAFCRSCCFRLSGGGKNPPHKDGRHPRSPVD
ncbi:MAG TPA: radical SAM protein [Fibrobacteraceae bacterium]|nr:radical SAM protein [Fibrobacteraceae bacterium]